MEVMIVSGGTAPSKKLLGNYIDKVDFIIAADKGSECLYSYNIIPDLLLGDFDSTNKEILNSIKLKAREVLEFPPEKDYTDTEIAIIEALKRGAEKIYLFGATGSRMDHTLGNVGLLLTTKKKGAILEIIDDHNKIYLAEKTMKLYGKYGENISFHALCDKVTKFKIKGAKYNLDSYDINLLDPRAICNEFLDTPIEISYEKGELLILHSID
ncbi:thiamine pyrophosphokinase [Clostridium saccharobutylicum]|uniref:thiamine diphosphokinase n=1 Tax=Clostridium saccharobutylicum TaxID=169679 RepID=UPI000983EE6B|nr:thiamine diphosphokinase [Clostridium saccharobutylicum]AQS09291.1 thiamine pyrophosphokinase [Clostridium saccharobutylicum]MBC2435207.1 thiamine diphosphokinase [Clostridium saccharobutylicum]NSB87528.1 thiamine pyrophosphokinase [Clostridium saccharobutylicum]NYC28342.1 thiamine pyrophosphokinase [Clostridium saccharobutylicum]OOM15538.1 thiamine pyrophosphokinase [Clostridium saccharobutylicum]